MTEAKARTEPVHGPAARALLAECEQELYARWDAPPPPTAASDAPPEPVDAGLAPPTGVFLVARLDDQPAGCVGLRTLDPLTGEIKRMYVGPDWRGAGLGRQLLAAAEQAAVELGLARVRLDTMAQLREARALYLSAGYRDIARYNTNPYAAHWMQKTLQPRWP